MQVKLSSSLQNTIPIQSTEPIENNGGFNHSQIQTEAKSIFKSNQKHLILFAYNRQKDETSPQQIMIMEQPKKKYKKETQAQFVNRLLQNVSLDRSTQQKFFLQKVDPLKRVQLNQQIKQILSVSNQLSLNERMERRKEIFQSSKARRKFDIASEEVLANRKIRVVKMDSLIQGGSIRGVVELGGRSIEYEQLNLGETNQQFYTLIKKQVGAEQIFPHITFQKSEIFGGISFQQQQNENQNGQNQDEYDSNDSDNPNFDYPEEEESNKSSEGIIGRDDDSDFQDRGGEDEQDEEELYRRYLKRLSKKEMLAEYEMQMEPQYQEYD